MIRPTLIFLFFFFNDTATTEIYTLSLHDALPICTSRSSIFNRPRRSMRMSSRHSTSTKCRCIKRRSEEHTSELQSRSDLVCRLLLEKKKKTQNMTKSQPLRQSQVTGNVSQTTSAP